MMQDEASLQLNENVRIFIKSLGSSYVNQIKWRTMWAFVVQRLKSENIVFGESFHNAPAHEKWGEPVRLRTTVKLLPDIYLKCDWVDSDASGRRRQFCDKYEGYSHVCRCKFIQSENCLSPMSKGLISVETMMLCWRGRVRHFSLDVNTVYTRKIGRRLITVIYLNINSVDINWSDFSMSAVSLSSAQEIWRLRYRNLTFSLLWSDLGLRWGAGVVRLP